MDNPTNTFLTAGTERWGRESVLGARTRAGPRLFQISDRDGAQEFRRALLEGHDPAWFGAAREMRVQTFEAQLPGCTITGHRIELYGLCADCTAKLAVD